MDLLTPKRFDLFAKYLYLKYKNKETNFYRDLYKNHIITFNNCYEHPGTKNTIDDFFKTFDELIEDMTKNGFNKDYAIPVYNNVFTNGAHRLMTSYFLGIEPKTIDVNVNENNEYNYDFFLNRRVNPPLDRKYADAIALEYVKHAPNLRAMIIYPTAGLNQKIFNIISDYGYVYYTKQIMLNQKGINNLIKEIYRGEEWIGGMFPRGFSPGGKAERCVAVWTNVFNLDRYERFIKMC